METAQGMSRHNGALVLLLTVPALFLLLYRLDELPRLDLDEGCWLLSATRVAAGGYPGAVSTYSLPVLRWWALATMQIGDGLALLPLRLFPVLLTVVMMVLLWCTARQWYGNRAGFYTLLVAAYCPFTLVWGRLFRTPYLLLAIINLLIIRMLCSSRPLLHRVGVLIPLFACAGLLHPIGLTLLPGTLLLLAGTGKNRSYLLPMVTLMAILLAGLVLANNFSLLRQAFDATALMARLQHLEWHVVPARLASITLGAIRPLTAGWVIGGLGYGAGVALAAAGDWSVLLLAIAAVGHAVITGRSDHGRTLVLLYGLATAGVAALLFASRHLGYAWALEDPQMQRFFIPLVPLLYLLLGRMLDMWLPLPAAAAVLIMLTAWLVPLLNWLGKTDGVVAREQWREYRQVVREHAALPGVTLYTDSWQAYLWLQVLGGETPRVRLLREPRYGSGYVETFFTAVARWQEAASRHACDCPGWYFVRDRNLCAVPDTAKRHVIGGEQLYLFAVAENQR